MISERPSQTLRVFISYARHDASEFAEELLAGLEVAGFDAFLDRHDIAGGEDWEGRLKGLLRSADTVVYVLTPASVRSERCAWEVARAIELSKRLIPVVAVEVEEAETPPALRRLNYIFFTSGHSFARSLGALATALRVDLDWIREHTRLSELAERWRSRDRPEPLLLRGSELESARAWLAGWRAGAPEPTDQQRSFIGEAETAEQVRTSVERTRLRRLRWLTYGAVAAVAAFLVASIVGALAVRDTRQQLDALSVELELKSAELAAAQGQLQTYADRLAEAAKTIGTSPGRTQSDAQALGRDIDEVRESLRTDLMPGAWRVDVFWCEALGQDSRTRAETVARLLRSPEAAGLGFAIGAVRVRQLSPAINARSGYMVDRNEVRPEASERPQGQALATFIEAQGGPALQERVSGTSTPGYLSVFLCGR